MSDQDATQFEFFNWTEADLRMYTGKIINVNGENVELTQNQPAQTWSFGEKFQNLHGNHAVMILNTFKVAKPSSGDNK